MSRPRTDEAEADPPIASVLDMSFQLLAFFILTFKSAVPVEGQIAIAPPPEERGIEWHMRNCLSGDESVRYILRVTATECGSIANINIFETGSSDEEGKDLGPDVAVCFSELQKRSEAVWKNQEESRRWGRPAPPPQLTLELGDNLVQAHVVQLIDSGVRAGFTEVAPVPADPKRR